MPTYSFFSKSPFSFKLCDWPDRPFHNFRTLKSVAQRSEATKNFLILSLSDCEKSGRGMLQENTVCVKDLMRKQVTVHEYLHKR